MRVVATRKQRVINMISPKTEFTKKQLVGMMDDMMKDYAHESHTFTALSDSDLVTESEFVSIFRATQRIALNAHQQMGKFAAELIKHE